MAAERRYAVVAIVLHWAIAAAIVANILIAWWMHAAIDDPATAARGFVAFQAHKSIGLSVLVLSLARLGWRFMHPPPPLPAAMPGWEKVAAKATHWAFYALMIALPLSGWTYVSAGWSHESNRPLAVPTYYFDLFRVPHLFGLEHAGDAARASVAEVAIEAHELMAWAMLALLALHVGAALKHWLIDRDDVLAQMAPGAPSLGPEKAPALEPPRRNALLSGFAIALIAAFAVGAYINKPLAAPPAPVAEVSPAPVVAEAPPAEAPPAVAPAPGAAAPSHWRVDLAQSAIEFSGDQGGQAFTGRFANWSAVIVFDPGNLAASHATVTIRTASAADGVPQHDEAMPGPDWFNVAQFPTATFRTSRIRHLGGDRYEAHGSLRIRDQSAPVVLPFTLTIQGDRATMQGRATLDRQAIGLGVGSDADSYVSRQIGVQVRVSASRAP